MAVSVKTIKDKTPKANQAIRDSFLSVPDTLTAKQNKALQNLRKALKYEVTE